VIENSIKTKLAHGETVFGLFVRYSHAGLAEFVSHLGWDFLLFDAEHSSMAPSDIENMSRAIGQQSVTSMARVPSALRHELLKFMDAGLGGVQAPWIESAEQAESVVQAVKYQPQGNRGLAGTRAADYGQTMPLSKYIEHANEQSMIVAQIESKAGVEAAEEICQVEGVDVIFIGPTDLSNSLGVTGQMDHPELLKAIDYITQCTLKNGKALGAYVSNAASAQQWIDRGATYITTTTEAMLAPGCKSYLSTLRQGASS